jgi:putative heme degradation protein
LDIKDDINIDVRTIFMNIFNSFNNIHSKENLEIKSKLQYFDTTIDKIPSHYNEQQKYLVLLNDTTSKLIRYSEQEKVLQDKLMKTRYADDTDINRNVQMTKIEQEIEKLNKTRDETISLYREIKNKYTAIMLVYDHVLFENLVLFNKIKKNFKMLGINGN